ncbi:MAG: PaaI family thioesterase, partial [Paracoccaceae bacterium]
MTQDIETRINDSFARQSLMHTLGATLERVGSGSVSIRAPLADHVLQQHGFGHAGLTFSIGDSAAGYSALTLFDADTEVLTAGIKINLLAPAKGD